MALNNNTCPVCGKAGISNYKKEEVVCPQCNSDLKTFMLLNRLVNNGRKKGRLRFIGAIALLTLTGGLFSKYLEVERTISHQKTTLHLYEDSIRSITMKQPVSATPFRNNIKQEAIDHSYFIYTVKNGDFTMRIARIFYNDFRKYKEIEQDNNLIEPYHLHKGDLLKIRINQ